MTEKERVRLLVVEDQPSSRLVFRRLLQPAGYVVSCAVDGEEACRMLEREKFDLVIMDYVLPGASGGVVGFEIAVHWPALPVIFTSGYPHMEDAVKATHPGAPFIDKAVIGDPARAHELLDLIANLLK